MWDYFGVLCHDDFWDETARLAREHRSLTDLRQARQPVQVGLIPVPARGVFGQHLGQAAIQIQGVLRGYPVGRLAHPVRF